VPGVAWRVTTQSTPIAWIVFAVSTKVSPLATLLPPAENSTVSAPNRLAAKEKLLRVRVLFSKNRLAHVFPVSSGNLRRQFSVASLSRWAVSSSSVNSAADKLCRSSR
jgi:hypothetical protein